MLNADGSWTYTLDNNNPLTDALPQGAHASDIFSYTESDHHGGFSTATLTIDITGTNDAPVTNASPVAATDVNPGAPVVEQGVIPEIRRLAASIPRRAMFSPTISTSIPATPKRCRASPAERRLVP